jgi:transcriptional regulator with XRE-family HTH domain
MLDQNKSNQLDSISKRLRYVVDTLGIKQSHMADKLGVSPSNLHYILNNDIRFSKNAKKIAEFLNLNEEWLKTGKGEIYEENNSVKTYKVPVYYPDQLKLFYDSKQPLMNTANYYITTQSYPNKLLAIYVTDNSFSPKFEPSDIVTFEQTQDFKDGDILLTYLKQPEALFIKYGFRVASDVILLSNYDSPKKLIDSNGDAIVGVYRECLKKNRAH